MRNILTVLIILLLSVYSFPKDKYLVYFKDKGVTSGQTLNKTSALYKEAMSSLTERAIERRRKTMGDNIISYDDLPIENEYINKLNSLGIEIVHKLTWFNAVSAYLDDSQLAKVKEFTFVSKVEPVKVMKFKKAEVEGSGIQKSNSVSDLNYGSSFTQLNLMDVPIVHSKGITGKGVLIGILDSGFRWKSHEALVNANVIAEYDFVFNDSVTANQAEDSPDQDSHGTSVMSEIAGYKDSVLIGASFGSSFLLAKTEYVPTETHVEEDNYAAALIWMENYGVDITTSSLGYSEFDSGQTSYTYQDMNGQTTIVVKACEEAFNKGVVTITAAGNERNTSWHYIISPADGFNTIAVGAVDNSNVVTSFSSPGPTSDGRIKPDIVAQGTYVYASSTSGFSNYTGTFAGTSAATPLAAGVAGLLLSAHPYLTNKQVRKILMETADNYSTPNNDRGYGLVSAVRAIDYPNVDSSNIVRKIFINDYAIDPSTVKINYSISGSGFTSENMTYDDTLRYSFVLPSLSNIQSMEFYFTYNDSSGVNYREPVSENYILTYDGDVVSLSPEINNVPTNYVLSQNYPNPFNGQTKINFVSTTQRQAELVVYNILGQKVKTLFNDVAKIGLNTANWNGKNEKGAEVSSGIYYYVLKIGENNFSKKMVLLK